MQGRDITHPRLDAVRDLIGAYRDAHDSGSRHPYERHMLGNLLTGDGPTEERLNAYVRTLLTGTKIGFDALKARGLLALTVEWVIADTERSHHRIWDADLVRTANARLGRGPALAA